ncbi:hypothetical protein QWT87_08815 [Chryseobacterium sp. APV1]|uniref:Tetratricopeptide repeat protein n=1 Tax=Chryseobacterium urinae TaxID=3058400 RepID=A0ABT8U5T4_9FLAO|nr:hypothetical protein [Chryseobacterium sp. APV1]MDO3424988.1 hypothetical protein [Chryseobacterium sp. APV1]
MNHRVLELLKTPKNIQSEDLNLLKEEINSFPYIQNIRALYLYGVHLYDKDNYQKVLSTTAAYTTDKKILYQLINGKIQQKPKPEIKLETVKEKNIPSENPLKILYQKKAGSFPLKREKNPASETQPQIVEESLPAVAETKETDRILPPPREEIKHLYVNGERNRILFEGEENFLEEDTFETIDLESTLESGSIVTQKAEKKEETASEEKFNENPLPIAAEYEEFIPETTVEEENVNSEAEQEVISDNSESESSKEETVSEIQIQEEENKSTKEQSDHISDEAENEELKPAEEISEFTPETIVEEENLNAEKEDVEDLSELSIHETEAFLPEVQVSANESVEEPKNESSQSENSEINASEESAEFTPETIIDEDEISSEKEEKVVQNDAELSFHGTESFLPEVKIQANTEDKITEAPQLNINKHEDEMRRLIEEVEKKMKEKAAAEEHKKEEEPENIGHDISFAETQSFEVKPIETEAQEEIKTENAVAENSSEQAEEPKAEVSKEKEEIPTKGEETEVQSAWKPMSFDSNLPDSLISKSPEVSQPKTEELKADEAAEIHQSEIAEQKQTAEAETESDSDEESIVSEISEETTEQNTDEDVSENSEENKEEVPVMNVSFFGSGWTIPQPEKEKMTEEPKQESKEEKTVEIPVEKPAKTAKPNVFDSNVPGFINTWQSWLKIDRTEEKPKEEKPDLKTKVIETFIENNPRISQLKEESTFVVKEKGDDISHLMTETLANLYFEQKLYTKAIKAFEILIKKTPEKRKYYEGKIQEIKDFRTKG